MIIIIANLTVIGTVFTVQARISVLKSVQENPIGFRHNTSAKDAPITNPIRLND